MNTKLKTLNCDAKNLDRNQIVLLKLIMHSEKQILENKTTEQKDVFKFIENKFFTPNNI